MPSWTSSRWGQRLAPAGAVLAAALLVPVAATATPSPQPSTEPDLPALVIAGPEEPGLPLRISGRVLDAVSGDPVAGAAIVVYHTDDDSEYEPTDPSDESTARLRGEMVSDEDGRFALRTILPGEYPDQPPGNRHIHVHSVSAEGYAPLGFVILFEDNVRAEVREWARDTGFGRVIVTTDDDGVLFGALDIPLHRIASEH